MQYEQNVLARILSKYTSNHYIKILEVTNDELIAEICVIANIVNNKQNLETYFRLLDKDDFIIKENKIIFQNSKMLFDDGKNIDLMTIIDQTKKNNVFSKKLLAEILDLTDSEFLINTYGYLNYEYKLKEYGIKRKLKILTKEVYADSDDKDIFELIKNLQDELALLTEFNLKDNATDIYTIAKETYFKLMKIRSRSSEKTNGVLTGFTELDLMNDGFDNGDLIVIAARPSMGKTAFALSMANNMARNGKSVGIFSIEMVGSAITVRLLSQITKIDSLKFKRANFDGNELEKVEKAIIDLEKLPLFVDDSSSLSLSDLRVKTKKMIDKSNIDVVIIDYLGIMKTGKEQNRDRELAVLTMGLKQIAKDFNIPVVVLSQLNRELTKRADKRPNLADLRDSGSIEQDADQVLLIHRPEYYQIKTFDDNLSTENIAEIIIGKNRNGPTGSVRLAFIKEFTLFGNLEYNYAYEPPPETKFKEKPLYADPYF